MFGRVFENPEVAAWSDFLVSALPGCGVSPGSIHGRKPYAGLSIPFGKLLELGYLMFIHLTVTRDRLYDPKIVCIAIPKQDIWHCARQGNRNSCAFKPYAVFLGYPIAISIIDI